ncbi:methylmalonyl Co-A mutase-associated GTPase MeaB [Salisaeta longa]|uniref:methylmalonyl Co-A mutase-associated GTPase MeaB n=1 Tax=Salisaeta longa TaxID=503170 RepID=UPI0003B5524D|nr:methylmalonyl Co-A mutase-associated GTPase MeaB [Salisaeta longa]
MSDASESHLSESSGAGGGQPLNPNLKQHLKQRRPVPSRDTIVDGLRAGDRAMLSRAITLLESTRTDHRDVARAVLSAVMPATGHALRVAITGVPGVGKSTFIEALGGHLIDAGHRLAVLAIDPSSTQSHGSILGDKTRMQALSARDEVFIRPSPTAGSLGGVARKTRETMLLCEAAGYDVVLVETVGVGQSEVTVHSMVDVFVLLALANAGDELQGIKRGIVEMADAVVINKAEGERRSAAERARRDFQNALHLFPPGPADWSPPVVLCSALQQQGIAEVWDVVEAYVAHTKANGFFAEQRHEQARHWMQQTIEQRLRDDFFQDEAVRALRPAVEARVLDGTLSSFEAAEQLLSAYHDAPEGS